MQRCAHSPFSSVGVSRSILACRARALASRIRPLGAIAIAPGAGSDRARRNTAATRSRIRVLGHSSSPREVMERERKLDPARHLIPFADGARLAEGLADHIGRLSAAAIARKGAFSVALSGGSLVATLAKLVEPPMVEQIDWSRWHVFWVDERVVRKDDPDSSYKLAHDLVLSKVAIPVAQVYSINDALDAEGAAEEYQTVMNHAVETGIIDRTPQGFPRLDLILLGMGPDGHIASLFPNHALTEERERWVAAITDSPKPPPCRITMTMPVINAAANVVFVASGAAKAEMVSTVFGDELAAGELPAQMVFPADGKLLWFVDRAAADAIKM